MVRKVLWLAGVAILFYGFLHYRSETRPQRLFQTYFTAIPPAGYGIKRSVAVFTGDPAREQTAEEASIYRQALRYHQEERYDYALMAWTAYLEHDPLPKDYRPHLLAATAAAASGDYPRAEELLAEMPRETEVAAASYHWYRALLFLRDGKIEIAAVALRQIPVRELTPDWRQQREALLHELDLL